MESFYSRLKYFWSEFVQVYNGIFLSKLRAPIYKELRKEEDLFLLLCFCDLLGLSNPVHFFTLELYPDLYERFHEWHRSVGMEKSPLDNLIKCC